MQIGVYLRKISNMKTNFEKLKDQFKKDTGKEWNEDISVYIAYYQAQMIENFVSGYYVVNKIQMGGR